MSISEGLIPLNDIETIIYFDCIYRHDTPPLGKGDPLVKLAPKETNSGPDEINAATSVLLSIYVVR